MTTAWCYLLIAGICEICWPIGLKVMNFPGRRILGIVMVILAFIFSSIFPWLAQRNIPIGTAYAVWTGIGAAGTMLVGIIFWHDPLTLWRVLGVMMIVGGVVLLKVAS